MGSRRRLMAMGATLALLAMFGYVLAWPTPIEPDAWTPPAAPGPTGDYAPNGRLAKVETRSVAPHVGPEAVAFDADGRIYAGVADGDILRFTGDDGPYEVFAQTKGRPLGMKFGADGKLYVADAKLGLVAVDEKGQVEVVCKEADGVAVGFADDLDIADDGTVYFSDASTKFGLDEQTAEVLEHRGNGRLISYSPTSGKSKVVLKNLYFANGVAVSADQSYLLVNETWKYRVRRYWLAGPKAGETDILIENLPGFPDNVRANPDGTFWVALFAPRNAMLDQLLPQPFWRKVIYRLPTFAQPAPTMLGQALKLDGNGKVVDYLEGAGYAPMTCVTQRDGKLYLGSTMAPALGILKE